MEIDDAFKIVGEYGSLQRRVFWSMALPQIFVAWQHILNAFVGAEPHFQCIGVNKKVYTDCKSADDNLCHNFVFNDNNFTSIVSEVSSRFHMAAASKNIAILINPPRPSGLSQSISLSVYLLVRL